ASTTQADTAAGGKAIRFSEHGFAIVPPAGHDAAQMQQVVTMMLPGAGGFTLLSEKHDARTATIEYKGTMQGQPLHWYARAFLAKNGLVLATGTALESQWKSASAVLRKSVDSLRPL